MKARTIAWAALAALLGCGRVDVPETVRATTPLTSNNGVWENGLTTNGVWENGVWENGVWENGVWENGVWENGVWENGLQGEALRSSPYTRQLLQYIYACAMPGSLDPVTNTPIDPTTYNATLDPNGGALTCSASTPCASGYTCSAQGTCVIPLVGAIGLGFNSEDGTTWWGSGNCKESCQRWVSACVLARTNAYGVHVDISLRAPPNAPQAIKNALSVSDEERATYTLREGAYYGNLFATTPTTGAPVGGNGPATGPIQSTPKFNACAGPGSNIPEITKRFCSSQGDQVVIRVPGVCLATPTQAGACAGEDADETTPSPTRGAIHGCYTTASTSPRSDCPSDHHNPNCYDEVLTVYLRQAISVCGDAVCDAAESATSCPSDCHPGGWAKSFDVNVGSTGIPYFDFRGSSAVSPTDGSIVIAGYSFSDVSFGGDVLPFSMGRVFVAKFASDGTYLRGTRFDMDAARIFVVVASDGSITVEGSGGLSLTALARLTPDVALMAGWPVMLGTAPVGDPGIGGTGRTQLTVDSGGNLFVTGDYVRTAIFPTMPPQALSSTPDGFETADIYVVKVLPDGTLAWATSIGSVGWDSVSSLTVEPSGDLLLATLNGDDPHAVSETTALRRVSNATGSHVVLKQSPAWNPQVAMPSLRVDFGAVAADAAGVLYATGSFHGSYDFGCGPATASAREFFLVKYSSDASLCRWVARATVECPPDSDYCNGLFAGGSLAFDRDGNVLVGGRLDALNGAYDYTPSGAENITASRGGFVDFGAGPFDNYLFPDVFVASYGAGGNFRWAQHVPMVLQGNLRGMSIDAAGHLVMSGTYTGSVQIDDRVLVNRIPENLGNNFANTYLASFVPPSPLDLAPPTIGAGADQRGFAISTVPRDFVVQATGPDGALVFFMLPTAIDDGNAGTSVACLPRPNSMFPIGPTLVTCTASDPLGHQDSASFTVTVVDALGPVFAPLADITVPMTGATVTYVATATDQVDGVRPVTCTVPSGFTFPPGSTVVTCVASDTRGNTSTARFTVTVGTPPILTLPGTITATATSTHGAVVTYSASAVDFTGASITPVCTPPSGSTFSLGPTTVNCTATDAYGMQASGSFQVLVEYAWSGILPPIDDDGSSVFKLGQTVPVKFRLVGASSGIANAVAKLKLAKVSAAGIGPEIAATSTSAANIGNTFRYDAGCGQYIFNLATKSLSVGTWRLSIDLGDSVPHTVTISLR
jgi:hypothetical protein